MRDSKIKCQNMLRLREKRLVDKLQITRGLPKQSIRVN